MKAGGVCALVGLIGLACTGVWPALAVAAVLAVLLWPAGVWPRGMP